MSALRVGEETKVGEDDDGAEVRLLQLELGFIRHFRKGRYKGALGEEKLRLAERLNEAEHARVHERDEQRDAHLAPDVAEDLPLRLRAHALAARLVALALLAREQEGEDEQDVDRVLNSEGEGKR